MLPSCRYARTARRIYTYIRTYVNICIIRAAQGTIRAIVFSARRARSSLVLAISKTMPFYRCMRASNEMRAVRSCAGAHAALRGREYTRPRREERARKNRTRFLRANATRYYRYRRRSRARSLESSVEGIFGEPVARTNARCSDVAPQVPRR